MPPSTATFEAGSPYLCVSSDTERLFRNGISGGADSVSLLLALLELRKREKLEHRIVAAHFNHNIRGAESDGDEQFVRELTARLGVELAIGRVEPRPHDPGWERWER